VKHCITWRISTSVWHLVPAPSARSLGAAKRWCLAPRRWGCKISITKYIFMKTDFKKYKSKKCIERNRFGLIWWNVKSSQVFLCQIQIGLVIRNAGVSLSFYPKWTTKTSLRGVFCPVLIVWWPWMLGFVVEGWK